MGWWIVGLIVSHVVAFGAGALVMKNNLKDYKDFVTKVASARQDFENWRKKPF